ncbi:Cdc6/Cdc18 family protein [Halorubrum sp. Atlit-26R]|uniref:Cdc6/Cdc18 family protein n=1 Tax=Halorubrum sp. Atlit-26R TaxID=2282128 RepID=UPI000EF1977E|nr:AAA family ATPase [Halorubrum sp. Atlit-26R]RLM63368.1 AAA family ATPase [Halorubrum sp. Atlit-26R]
MSLFETDTNVFENERALMEEWVPDRLPKREPELEEIAKSFRTTIRSGIEPKNVLISGKTGQGKTVTARVVLEELHNYCQEEDIDLRTFEVSLKDVNTAYQSVGKILTAIEPETTERPKGLSLTDLNERMFRRLDEIGGYVVFFLDEIDNLGSDDDLLYQLPRARSNGKITNAHLSIIGISNDLQFKQDLSAKTKDSLYENEVHFDPYNADELRSILYDRVDTAFKPDAVDDGVVELAAAWTAKDTGSARQAIRLLHEAGDIACVEGSDIVTEAHLDDARDELEEVNIVNKLKDLTINDQALLMALAILESRGDTPVRTKEVYSEYKRVADAIGTNQLTSRSIRDKLTNLDTYNLAMTHKRKGGVQGGDYYLSELRVNLDSLLEGFEHVEEFDGIVQDVDTFSRQSTLS